MGRSSRRHRQHPIPLQPVPPRRFCSSQCEAAHASTRRCPLSAFPHSRVPPPNANPFVLTTPLIPHRLSFSSSSPPGHEHRDNLVTNNRSRLCSQTRLAWSRKLIFPSCRHGYHPQRPFATLAPWSFAYKRYSGGSCRLATSRHVRGERHHETRRSNVSSSTTVRNLNPTSRTCHRLIQTRMKRVPKL